LTFQVKCACCRSNKAGRELENHLGARALRAFDDRAALDAVALAQSDNLLAFQIHQSTSKVEHFGLPKDTMPEQGLALKGQSTGECGGLGLQADPITPPTHLVGSHFVIDEARPSVTRVLLENEREAV
jgi:hypothetical protein